MNKLISLLFVLAALYDGLLGFAFLLGANAIFKLFAVPPPNHFGYVQFSAALLIVFAIMFLSIASNPAKKRELIIYGILLKFSYCAVVFSYWFTTGIPYMWKPFAIFDFVFMLLFLWAFLALGRKKDEPGR